jgi:hypothetical protein
VTLFAELYELFAKLSMGFCSRHTASVVLKLACTYSLRTHTRFNTLKTQRTHVALASAKPISAKFTLTAHSTNLL